MNLKHPKRSGVEWILSRDADEDLWISIQSQQKFGRKDGGSEILTAIGRDRENLKEALPFSWLKITNTSHQNIQIGSEAILAAKIINLEWQVNV